jgi:superfamily II DNA or RNA helicase
MLKDVKWADDRDYNTGSEDEPLQFYLDALCNSSSFDLLLGYFSSSAINVLSLGFANFIHKGGKMRAIINNVLSEEDKKAIEKGQDKDNFSTIYDFSNIRELESSLDQYGRHFFECFAWMIANDKIEIKIIKPKNRRGISHYKAGVFGDGENSVGFNSTCNFSYFGFVENLEHLDCSLSWEDERSLKKIKKQEFDFEKIFSEKSDLVDYLKTEDVKLAIKDKFGDKDIGELLIQEKELLSKRNKLFSNPKIKKSVKFAMEQINEFEKLEKQPQFPFDGGPREYQKEAYQKWDNNGNVGLFAMATGTGKTLTSAYCLVEQYKLTGVQKNIIVVPGKELVEQWYVELKQSKFSRPIRWYSGNSRLKKDIEYINLLKHQSNFKELNIIITYKSFSSEKFLNIFKTILKDFIVVFDETHNMGAGGFMNAIKDLSFEKRIGLSATPLRLWDENNENQFIEDFFKSPPPYTYSYSMEEAIKNGFLCKYHYEPYFVTFSDDEWEEYLILTRQLHNKQENETINTKAALKRQLLKDQAINKGDAVLEIIEKLVEKDSFKNTLIYCPKGVNNEEDDRYIHILQDEIKEKFPKINTATFLGETSNRELLLKDFENEIVHMLLAIKCLDEGVNIPKTMNAIFVASGQNYREFVQRRGRVLRNYQTQYFKKEYADIFDVVVLPTVNQFNSSRQTAERLIISEFRRLYEFYNLAADKFSTYKKINNALEVYGLTEGYIRTKVNNNE